MARCMTGPIALAATFAAMAGAATAQVEVLFDQGEALYGQNCELCHQPSGLGVPPDFPALSGNPIVADISRIVANIHQGRGNMPAFPTFSADELAAIATYVRGTWLNNFSPAEPEDVALILERLGGPTEEISIWEGVYTVEQAKRGQAAYLSPCGLCHGRRLDGAPDDADMRPAPPLARAKFIRNWNGRSLATLFEFTRATMPQSNPGYLDEQTYADIIAHMLLLTGVPAGEVELTPDRQRLATIVIAPKP